MSRLVSGRPFRIGLVVAVVAVVVGGLLALLLNRTHATVAKPVVIVYGDSLTVESEAAAQQFFREAGQPTAGERLVFRARDGTAMCDWVTQARKDLAALHPQRIVLAFTGNTASCAASAFLSGGADGATDLYEHSLRQMRAVFATQPITIVVPPAMDNLPPGWFPFNGNHELVTMYKSVGPQLHMAVSTNADDWLTPGHVFVWKRPAYPSHAANGPLVTVRLADGVHLTDAGRLWYGAALAQAAL